MPSKYIVKKYLAGGVYHVYNRGVEKRLIFMDMHDYRFFLYLIKSYLLDPQDQKPNPETQLKRGIFKNRIEILAYALMPNHFHLLIKQIDEHDLAEFMKSLMTTYVIYFNRKYKRTGTLFQGAYKAILVENDDYLLHLSRYIHLNPQQKGETFLPDDYTSYYDYLGKRDTKWINQHIILNYFQIAKDEGLVRAQKYQDFVENLDLDEGSYLGEYAIDKSET